MIKRLFPFIAWQLDAQTLRADLLAGMSVALVLIPQSMAYAQLAGLPAYFGLYIAFLPVMVAALWGSSKQLATGPVAIVSIMTATALAPVVGGTALSHPELASVYIPLAMFMALLVGLVQLFLGLFRLGILVNFLSHPVIVGFINAAAMVIALSQISKLFGLSLPGEPSDHFLTVRIWGVIQQLGDTHLPTLLMGLAAFALMFSMKRFRPQWPGVLVAVVASTLISWLIGFERLGGEVVGSIPVGLPVIALPPIDMELLGTLLPSAIIISLVGFMEAISIARAMAARTRDRIDPNQELIGQGLGNIVGSFSQAYPASGSFSRSAVNLNAGARTGMSSVVTAMAVLITMLFFTPLLYHLPSVVLAAVIMLAVFGLVNIKAVKQAWQANRHDGIASVVTFAATLALAPALGEGILLGAGLSILLFLSRTMRPRVVCLGHDRDGMLRDAEGNTLPGDENISVLSFDGSLYFGNVSYFEQAVLEADSAHPKVKYVLVVSDGINEIDASGEEVLRHLVERLRDSGITMSFSGLNAQVLSVMHATGLYGLIGRENIFSNEETAIAALYHRLSTANGPLAQPV